MKKTLDNFINQITLELKLKKLDIDYIYDEESNYYQIRHIEKKLDTEIKYRKIIGRNILKYFYEKNIYNISFGYSYSKHENFYLNKYINSLSLTMSNLSSVNYPSFTMEFDKNYSIKTEEINKEEIPYDKFYNIIVNKDLPSNGCYEIAA